MVAYTFRMPAGIPGEVNRAQTATIVTEILTPSGTTGAPTAYGIPVVIDATSGQVRSMTSTDTAAYGVLVRPYPTNSSQDPLGTSTPPTSGPCDVLRRGFIQVLLSVTQAATNGGQVYIWTAAPSGSHITGGWEAANPGGSGISAPAQSFFQGPADSNGNTEISFNL